MNSRWSLREHCIRQEAARSKSIYICQRHGINKKELLGTDNMLTKWSQALIKSRFWLGLSWFLVSLIFFQRIIRLGQLSSLINDTISGHKGHEGTKIIELNIKLFSRWSPKSGVQLLIGRFMGQCISIRNWIKGCLRLATDTPCLALTARLDRPTGTQERILLTSYPELRIVNGPSLYKTKSGREQVRLSHVSNRAEKRSPMNRPEMIGSVRFEYSGPTELFHWLIQCPNKKKKKLLRDRLPKTRWLFFMDFRHYSSMGEFYYFASKKLDFFYSCW